MGLPSILGGRVLNIEALQSLSARCSPSCSFQPQLARKSLAKNS